jgi:hypothetical protein
MTLRWPTLLKQSPVSVIVTSPRPTLIVLQLVLVDNEVMETDTGSKTANVGRNDDIAS